MFAALNPYLVSIFAVAVLLPLSLNWIASRHDFKTYVHPFGVSVMVVGFWVMNRLWDIPTDFPASRLLNPVFEFLGGAVCIHLALAYRQPWAWMMAFMFFILSAIHAYYLPAWYVDNWFFEPTPARSVEYTTNANAAWMLSLLVCSMPGGGHAYRRIRDRLNRRSWIDHRAGGVA